MSVTQAPPYQKGYLRGQMDRGKDTPEPVPPYPQTSPEANAWLRGYRAGRKPVVGPSETKKDATAKRT